MTTTQEALRLAEEVLEFKAINQHIMVFTEADAKALAAIREMREPVKCIVKNCQNHPDQGKFIGDLCSPCHNYLATGEGKHSQAYRNSLHSVLVVDDLKATVDHLGAVISMAMDLPQREWVSLSDHDMLRLARQHEGLNYNSICAIEAKLKEKNK